MSPVAMVYSVRLWPPSVFCVQLLRKVVVANWLAFVAFAQETVMLGQGFTENHRALAACRALLGLSKAGL